MPFVEIPSREADSAFAQIANAALEVLLKQLTLDEEVALLTGDDFWHTVAIPRLGIPSIRLSDDPNGVRGHASSAVSRRPVEVWGGWFVADNAKAKGAHVILGPTIIIQRGPLGGRGFESYSEDPLLAGFMAGHYCKGLQQKNISATLKHFVCNDQEHERTAVNSIVTDRTMREVRLLLFMLAIGVEKPDAIMTAYNKGNGIHTSESPEPLQDILRSEWGWNGQFGTYSTSEAVQAGLDLEMPGPFRWRGSARAHAVTANKVSTATLNARGSCSEARKRLRTGDGQTGFTLKIFNDPSTILTREPLDVRHETDAQVLFLDYNHPGLQPVWYAEAEGDFVPEESGRYDFGRSLRPWHRKAADPTRSKYSGGAKTVKFKIPGVVDFGHGGFRFGACKQLSPEGRIEQAVKLAASVDLLVGVAGLSAEWESEGEDRTSMRLLPHTDDLIARVLKANPDTAVLHAWYGGYETGNGLADVIFGDVNPSSKLPLTFPRRLKDNLTYFNFSSEVGRVLCGEDVHVGYIFYDAAEIEPCFLPDMACLIPPSSCRTWAWRGSQEEVVTIPLDLVRATSSWDERSNAWCSHCGTYRILVGTSSRGKFPEGTIEMEETTFWSGI
ncbi:glycoside hydrolase [Aspergillus homomorphus CBS 101889]|uniref:beta-glucosidase n=1 Tax=Aspergillus homomorphus (strain CBS 101889) TaxID=1450537 RepID=A0A395HK77_ASPHC|nr:glycoside hydrolase [Aspergillus homomorphus CBS 101889]RAL07919.1 glycoside hydrolase [Aspergillus homomorphus CBS 101889]